MNLKNKLKLFFRKTKYNTIHIVDGLNLNPFDHGTNAKIQDYRIPHSKLFHTRHWQKQPPENTPGRLLLYWQANESDQKNTTIINHILTNTFVNTKISTGIVKSDN